MKEQGEKCDVLFMDPPRAGSTEEFLTAVKTLAPKKLVYVSCNPVTLSRDLEFITKNGYGEAVMMSVKLYEEMFAKMQAAALINAALDDIENGATPINGKVFFEDMRAKYGK